VTDRADTVTVTERWFGGDHYERKIGDGPWRWVENPYPNSRVPYILFQGDDNMAVNTDYTHDGQQRISKGDIDQWFTYHAPKGDQQERYQNLREIAKELALLTHKYCPPCADTTDAIRQLRKFVMAANLAIACNE
jgi:hypothetical protein